MRKLVVKLMFYSVKILLLGCSILTLKNRKTHYEIVVYKVDGIGDWFLGQAAIGACLCQSSGKCLLIVANTLGEAARAGFPQAEILEIAYTGDGLNGVLKNFRQLIHLATKVETRLLVSFRHYVNPLREITFACVSAERKIVWNTYLPTVQADYPWLCAQVKCEFSIPSQLLERKELCGELRRHTSVLIAAFGANVAAEIRPRLKNSAAPRAYVVIVPFARIPIKNYSEPAWGELIRQIAGKYPAMAFDMWMSHAQTLDGMALSERISKTIGVSVGVRVAAGFSELKQIADQASLVITVDTAMAHIATALDKPAIILLGGGHFGEFGPWHWSRKQRWLTNELVCFGCGWKCIHDQPICITEISPDLIAAQACELLSLPAE